MNGCDIKVGDQFYLRWNLIDGKLYGGIIFCEPMRRSFITVKAVDCIDRAVLSFDGYWYSFAVLMKRRKLREKV